VLGVLLGAEVIIAIVFSIVEIAHPAGGTLAVDTLDPTQLVSAGTGAALATAVAGFVGFESTRQSGSAPSGTGEGSRRRPDIVDFRIGGDGRVSGIARTLRHESRPSGRRLTPTAPG